MQHNICPCFILYPVVSQIHSNVSLRLKAMAFSGVK
jgi:hypothetical protein